MICRIDLNVGQRKKLMKQKKTAEVLMLRWLCGITRMDKVRTSFNRIIRRNIK